VEGVPAVPQGEDGTFYINTKEHILIASAAALVDAIRS
jgi:hypothetical protein